MIRKEKHSRSYSSIMSELIRDGYISKDSTEIPLEFINSEAKNIRLKISKLPADIRTFISGMEMIDTLKKEVDAKRAVSENKGAEEIIMASKA